MNNYKDVNKLESKNETYRIDRLSDRDQYEIEQMMKYIDVCSVCKKPLKKLKCSGCMKEPSLCTCLGKLDRFSDREFPRYDTLSDREEGKKKNNMEQDNSNKKHGN